MPSRPVFHCQQDELYRAEDTLPQKFHGARFSTQAELQAYVDDLRELPYWQIKFPNVRKVEAVFHRGPGSVGGFFEGTGVGRIQMGPNHRDELTVIHEVAHVLAGERYGSAGHSPWFARIYLELAAAALDTDTYLALYDAFEAANIDTATDDEGLNGGVEL